MGKYGGGGGGIKAVMGRQMKLSLCSHVYSTFFHHVHTTHPPTPLPTLSHARIHSSVCRPHPSCLIRRRQQTCKRVRMNTNGHYPSKYNAWVFYLKIFEEFLSRLFLEYSILHTHKLDRNLFNGCHTSSVMFWFFCCFSKA